MSEWRISGVGGLCRTIVPERSLVRGLGGNPVSQKLGDRVRNVLKDCDLVVERERGC